MALIPDARRIETAPGTRYLQLQMISEKGEEAEALFDPDQWLAVMDTEFPDIPWLQVPLSYLAEWMQALKLRFLLEETYWFAECITVPERDISGELIRLPTQPCPLYCFSWPPALRQAAVYQRNIIAALPFTLRYVLGHSQLPLSTLIDVERGDLLRIRDYSPQICLDVRRLFHFCYTPDKEVYVEDAIQEYSHTLPEDEFLAAEWSELPVEIEFVLDRLTVSLGELHDVAPGRILPLTPGAETNIRVYMNRKLLAVGELVSLDEGGLAVDISQVILGNTKSAG